MVQQQVYFATHVNLNMLLHMQVLDVPPLQLTQIVEPFNQVTQIVGIVGILITGTLQHANWLQQLSVCL